MFPFSADSASDLVTYDKNKIFRIGSRSIGINLWEIASFENEALENEDRSTKHPNLENEAP